MAGQIIDLAGQFTFDSTMMAVDLVKNYFKPRSLYV